MTVLFLFIIPKNLQKKECDVIIRDYMHSIRDNDKRNNIKSHSIGCEYYFRDTKSDGIKIETRTSYGSVSAFRRDSLSGIRIETRTDCVFAFTHNSQSYITDSDSIIVVKKTEVTLWYIFVYMHTTDTYLLDEIIYTCDILFLYMYMLLKYTLSNLLKCLSPTYIFRCNYSNNLLKIFSDTPHLQFHLHFHSSMNAIFSVRPPLDTNITTRKFSQKQRGWPCEILA